MNLLRTVAVAFAMFSAVPVPQVKWDRDSLRYALCAFPLVGALVGLACWGWAQVCALAHLPPLMRGAGLCLIPVFLTGGIHLDGFCDTWDALASRSGPERKREILKDPHLGAFGAIHLCCYFLLTFALWSCLPRFPAPAVVLSFCLSRSLSALAVASFPLAAHTGLAHTFAQAADKKRVRAVLGALSLGLLGGLCLQGAAGAAMALAALGVFVHYRHTALKQFGGLSGDLAGWFLQRAELGMLIALFAAEVWEEML